MTARHRRTKGCVSSRSWRVNGREVGRRPVDVLLALVLKPGGRRFSTTPNYLGFFGLYRGYLRVRGRRYTEEGQPIDPVMVLPLTLRWVRQAGLQINEVDAKNS